MARDGSRIPEYEVAGDQHICDVELLVLGTWWERLGEYLWLDRLCIFVIFRHVPEVLLVGGLHQFDDLFDFLGIDGL